MLVLTRKVGEKIVIDETITIEVVEIHGKRVRLGVHAPKKIPIHRAEQLEAPPSGPSAENAEGKRSSGTNARKAKKAG